jgi:hypothetical protein
MAVTERLTMSRLKRFETTFKWNAAFLLTATLLKVVHVALRHSSYRRVSQWMLRLSPIPDSARRDVTHARAIAYLVDKVAQHPRVAVTCLRRSLVLWYYLRWLGLPSDVRVAVNRSEGHAWVEHNGEVVNDDPDVAKRFMIIYGDALNPEKVANFELN